MTPIFTSLDRSGSALPLRLPSPFDEAGPQVLARVAAERLMAELEEGRAGLDPKPFFEPDGGKMFGVLVVEDTGGRIGFLRAFSGTLGGRFEQAGFAPPLFDRSARAAVETDGERLVKRLAARAEAFVAAGELRAAWSAFEALRARQQQEMDEMRASHRARREQRRAQRRACGTAADGAWAEVELERLAQQSRADKAERRRLEAAQAAELAPIEARYRRLERRRAAHARLQGMVSRRLMRQIHDSYVLRNARGETAAMRSLFGDVEPPGGAGDCAAPKLLACALAGRLRPIALAEFWWGATPASGGRLHRQFYPACREKCGPLLPFLLEGLDVAPPLRFERGPSSMLELRIVHEDEWIVVVDKPPGLLSVPSRADPDGDCVLARLRAFYPQATGPLLVHRLDLDTSGLLVATLRADLHALLQKQFVRRSVEKRYVAVLDGEVQGDGGRIDLAIRVDPADRPRQVHDALHGRAAVTHWTLIERAGGRSRVALFPRSGRTHQLRVHAAQPLGLAAPIVGDRLYGRGGEGRLLLHAEELAFEHPASGQRLRVRSDAPF